MLERARKHRAGPKPAIVAGSPIGALTDEERDVLTARAGGTGADAALRRLAGIPEQRLREIEESLQAKGYR